MSGSDLLPEGAFFTPILFFFLYIMQILPIDPHFHIAAVTADGMGHRHPGGYTSAQNNAVAVIQAAFYRQDLFAGAFGTSVGIFSYASHFFHHRIRLVLQLIGAPDG